jgi:hypothetical protein
MSDRYEYIPTITILKGLLDEGYTCHEVAQSNPYKKDKDAFVKHMLRLRAPKALRKKDEVIPEVVIINSHDGTSQYQLFGGLYRFICANGLVAGDTFASIIVRHSGFGTAQKVVDASHTIVKEQFPKMLLARQAMLDRIMHKDEQIIFAHRALALRYPNVLPPFSADRLLQVRRVDDEPNDVWHVYNRVQENLLEGGFTGRGNGLYQRALTVRPVQQVGSVASINRGLWDHALALVA